MFLSTITADEIGKLGCASFPGEIYVVEEEGELFDGAVSYLERQTVIGFDTETRPCFSPSQPRYGVALLQLSGAERAYLFRIQSLGLHSRLCRLLENPRIIKVGAAIHDDINGLQRYACFEAKGFIDLQKIVWEWGIRDKSVKKMSAIILGFRISKTQQLSNWEAAVLSEAQEKYAATDAWVCREMYLRLLSSEKNPLDPENH